MAFPRPDNSSRAVSTSGRESSPSKTTIVERDLESLSPHPFGGCERLRGHYRTIGSALLRLEREGSVLFSSGLFSSGLFSSGMLPRGDLRIEREFREAVTFVPAEVLSSFFDDLLDAEIPDERLSISHRSWAQRLMTSLLSIFGLLLAVLSGLYLSAIGTALPASFLLMVVLGTPFATMLYLSAGGAARRLRFAQVVSREISRRRGDGNQTNGAKPSTAFQGAALRLKDLLSPQPSQPAARIVIVSPPSLIH